VTTQRPPDFLNDTSCHDASVTAFDEHMMRVARRAVLLTGFLPSTTVCKDATVLAKARRTPIVALGGVIIGCSMNANGLRATTRDAEANHAAR
jgi:hypothetical protein